MRHSSWCCRHLRQGPPQDAYPCLAGPQWVSGRDEHNQSIYQHLGSPPPLVPFGCTFDKERQAEFAHGFWKISLGDSDWFLPPPHRSKGDSRWLRPALGGHPIHCCDSSCRATGANLHSVSAHPTPRKRPTRPRCALEPGSAGSEWIWKPKLKAKESADILVHSYHLSEPLSPYVSNERAGWALSLWFLCQNICARSLRESALCYTGTHTTASLGSELRILLSTTSLL